MTGSKTIPARLDDMLGFNLDRVANLFRLELIQVLADYDLTPEQWQIMALIWYSETPLRQQDISDLLVKDKHNISRIVKRLEVKGWLAREADPRARAFFLRPTVLGRRLENEVLNTLHAHFDELGTGLTPAQTQEFVALLKIVRAHLHDDVARKPGTSEL